MMTRLIGRRLRFAVAASTLVVSAACVSFADRTDQTAMNLEDTGDYWVLSSQQPEPGMLRVRLKVERLEAVERIAKDFVHQKANQGFRKIRLDFVGPMDEADSPARRQLRWPEDVDYMQN
jgi:hypothetical protein